MSSKVARKSASYNVITTSHEYNFNPAHTEQSMRWAEVQIGNKIEELTEKYKDTGGFRDMDMNVNIVWGDPDDDLLVGLLVDEAMDQAAAKGEIFEIVEEEKRIRDQIRANWAAYEKRHPGTKLQRVLMMDYNVDMHFFIGEEETTTEVFQTGIGPDKWLLGVK